MSEERRQGQAQTDAERAIEAAIARVPLWQGRHGQLSAAGRRPDEQQLA